MTQTQPETAKELLVNALERIKNPEHWCQDFYAINAEGADCNPWDTNACRWCADGALLAAYHSLVPESGGVYDKAIDHLDAVAKSMGFVSIVHLNDDAAHSTVVAAFQKAIEAA